MLVLPGLTLMILFQAYINPLDIWPGFANYPYVYFLMLGTTLGLLLDWRGGKTFKLYPVPHLWLALAFVLWCVFTDAVHNPAQIKGAGIIIITSGLLFVIISHGCQSFRAIRYVTGVILAIDLVVAYVAVGEGFGPYTCQAGGKHVNFVDDRSCDPEDTVQGTWGVGRIPRGCAEGDGFIEGVVYNCERRGPFGYLTVEGRSTGFGWLEDPNDVALATGIGLPFAFAFREQKKGSLWRLLFLAFTLVLFGLAAVYTKSRGGQLVFLTVLLVYFVRKYGITGLFAAVIAAAPLMVLGGRGGTEASNSANHRLELWLAAVNMLVANPITGVGCKEFMKHSTDACHSAYANAFAELGLPGYFMYLSMVYWSIKIAWKGLVHCSKTPGAKIGEIYSLAIMAAVIGQQVGLLFLSETYNFTVWIHYGLTGALYSSIKKKSPEFKVKFTYQDFAIVVVLGILFIAGIVFVNKVFPPEVKLKTMH